MESSIGQAWVVTALTSLTLGTFAFGFAFMLYLAVREAAHVLFGKRRPTRRHLRWSAGASFLLLQALAAWVLDAMFGSGPI